MSDDRDLLVFRQSYYALLVSLFWKEPAKDVLLSLSNGIKERTEAAHNLHPLLAQGWEELERFLVATSSEQLAVTVADEYTRLFVGPYGVEINPYESFYLTGNLLDRPLAELRTFLKAVGIEKEAGYPEPEDFLAFELEVMRWLISKQIAATEPDEGQRWLRLQLDFLKEHLLVWAPACAEEIEKAKNADFYRGGAMILRGFMEVERIICREWGLDKVVSLDEVRQRWRAIPAWKGPTFDFSVEETKGPPPRQK